MLEDRIGVYEVEAFRGKVRQIAATCMAGMRVGNIAQLDARLRDHFIRYIDAVNFAEVAAHGTHEAAGSAADFKGAAHPDGNVRGQAFQLAFEIANNVGCGVEELSVILFAPAKSHVVVRVFAGAFIPLGSHAVLNGFHAVILALCVGRFGIGALHFLEPTGDDGWY